MHTIRLDEMAAIRIVSRRTGETLLAAECEMGNVRITKQNDHAMIYARGRDIVVQGALYDREGAVVRFAPDSRHDFLASFSVEVSSL